MIDQKIENMTLVELVDYITKTFHVPLRENIKKLEYLVALLETNNIEKYPEIENLKVLFMQFRAEILKHITREDFITFPAIIKYEKIYTDNLTHLSDNFDIMDSLINDVKINNQHMEFDLYLSSIIALLEESYMNEKGIKEYDEAKAIFFGIFDDNIIHSEIENKDLYFKGLQLQEKLKEKLKSI